MNLLDLMVKVGVDDQASGKIAGIAGNVKGKLASAAKAGAKAIAAFGAASAGAAVAVGKGALDSYASYEQLSGGISKLFGTAGQTLEQYAQAQGKSVDEMREKYGQLEQAQSIAAQNAQNAYKTAGMSANDYMEQVSGFAAALTSSLGGDTVKAAEQADKAMRSISDNVNTFGTDMEAVSVAYQGFAKQNYTMLDNLKLGYGGTKSEMERLIADANEWGAANGQASNLSIESFSDVVTAIDQIQQKQQIAGTTAREAGTTIEGSVNSAKAAWTNLLTELGKEDGDIPVRMTELFESVFGDGTDGNLGVVGNVVPAMQRVAQGVGDSLRDFGPRMGEALKEHGPQLIASAVELFMNVAAGFGQALPLIISAIWESGPLIAQAFADNEPKLRAAAKEMFDGLIRAISEVTGIAEGDLSSGVLSLIGTLGDLTPAIAGVVGGLLAFKGAMEVAALVEAVTTAIKTFKTAQEAATIQQALLNAVMNANPFVLIATLVGTLIAAFAALYATNEGFRNAVNSAWNAITGAIGGAIGAVIGFFSQFDFSLEGLLQAGQATIDALGEAFSGGLDGLAANVEYVITHLPEIIIGGIGGMIEAGGEFFGGLVDGFLGKEPEVDQTASEVAEGAADAALDAADASDAGRALTDSMMGEFDFGGVESAAAAGASAATDAAAKSADGTAIGKNVNETAAQGIDENGMDARAEQMVRNAIEAAKAIDASEVGSSLSTSAAAGLDSSAISSKMAEVTKLAASAASATVKIGVQVDTSQVRSASAAAGAMTAAYVQAAARSSAAMRTMVSAAQLVATQIRSAINIPDKTVRVNVKRGSVELPHFWMSGEYNLKTGSVPKTGVSWYAKGAIFAPNKPGLAGLGDAPEPEVAAPLSALKDMLGLDGRARMVNNIEMNYYGHETARDLLGDLQEYFALAELQEA